jgi:hypothetical protein
MHPLALAHTYTHSGQCGLRADVDGGCSGTGSVHSVCTLQCMQVYVCTADDSVLTYCDSGKLDAVVRVSNTVVPQ